MYFNDYSKVSKYIDIFVYKGRFVRFRIPFHFNVGLFILDKMMAIGDKMPYRVLRPCHVYVVRLFVFLESSRHLC